MAKIRIEFFGIARQRAGTPSTMIETAADTISLSQVLQLLAARFPEFDDQCVDGGRLAAGYVANLDGNQFVNDPSTTIRDGSSLLVMSSDAGG